MGTKSQVLADAQITKWLLPSQSGYVPTGQLYVNLLLSEPAFDIQPAQNIVSVTTNDSAYVRQAINFFNTSAHPFLENSNSITFPAAVLIAGDYDVNFVVIEDEDGVWLYSSELTNTITVTTGTQVTIPVRTLRIEEGDKPLSTALTYLQWTLKGSTSGLQPPTETFLALMVKNADGDVVEIDTTNYNSNYKRQTVFWKSAIEDEALHNLISVSFERANLVGASALARAFVVTHVALYTALTGGDKMYEAPLEDDGTIVVMQDTFIQFRSNVDKIIVGEN